MQSTESPRSATAPRRLHTVLNLRHSQRSLPYSGMESSTQASAQGSPAQRTDTSGRYRSLMGSHNDGGPGGFSHWSPKKLLMQLHKPLMQKPLSPQLTPPHGSLVMLSTGA